MGGHSATHMASMRMVPATAAIRRATPAMSATPMPSSAAMNSQSVAVPAIDA